MREVYIRLRQDEQSGLRRGFARARLHDMTVYPQVPDTRRSDPTSICRSFSMPVTLTRCPTWLVSRMPWVGSLSWSGAEPLCIHPDFQLRDFGASAPLVSVRRNAAASVRSRQPAIVTGDRFAVAVSADASGSGVSVAVSSGARFAGPDVAATFFIGNVTSARASVATTAASFISDVPCDASSIAT